MAWAIVGGGILAAGGAIGGAAIGSSAAGEAADKQAAAAREANALQKYMFEQQRSDHEPWRQAGMTALYGGLLKRKDGGTGGYKDPGALNASKEKFLNDQWSQWEQAKKAALDKVPSIARDQVAAKYAEQEANVRAQIESKWAESPEAKAFGAGGAGPDEYEVDPELTRGFTNDDFVKDPGYDFRMKEGQKALERSAAARGGLNSGATMKALSRYGQDFASNEFQNAYNRFNNDRSNRFNRLSSIAGLGQAANQQIGQAGMNYANQVGQNTMGAANAHAAAGIAQGNAWGNSLSTIGQAANQGLWMDRYMSAQKSPTVSPAGGGGSNLDFNTPAANFFGLGGND